MNHPKYPAALAALNDLFGDTSVSRSETLEAIEELIAEAEMLEEDLRQSLKPD